MGKHHQIRVLLLRVALWWLIILCNIYDTQFPFYVWISLPPTS